MTRAEYIRGLVAQQPDAHADAVAANCIAAGYERPTRQAIERALAHKAGAKRGRPRQKPPSFTQAELASVRLTARWEQDASHGYHYLRSAGAVHATVRRDWDNNRVNAGQGNEWIVWTAHTEGNDRFRTEAQAKAHAEQRLLRLWAELAPAFATVDYQKLPRTRAPGNLQTVFVETHFDEDGVRQTITPIVATREMYKRAGVATVSQTPRKSKPQRTKRANKTK